MMLRFEVSVFEAESVVLGLRAQAFAAVLEPRRHRRDVAVVAIEVSASNAEEIRDTVQILASSSVEAPAP